MAVSLIAQAAANYRLRRAQILDTADQAAQTLRRDLGLPRDKRQWSDHPGLYNKLQGEVVLKLEQLREQGVADLRAARAETRHQLYKVQDGPEGGINRALAMLNYRQALEHALALPLGEPGWRMAQERMRAAVLTGDEQSMAALSLLAEERADGQRGACGTASPGRGSSTPPTSTPGNTWPSCEKLTTTWPSSPVPTGSACPSSPPSFPRPPRLPP